MRASRRVVDAAVARGDVVYGVNTGFGKLADVAHPARASCASCSSTWCARTPPASATPLGRGRGARDDAAARQRARQGLLGRAARDARARCSRCSTRRASRSCRRRARSARPATSRRSRTSRSRSSARARRASTGRARARRARRSRRAGPRARSRSSPRKASRSSTARSSSRAVRRSRSPTRWRLCATADVVGALTLEALLGTDVAFDPRIHAARPHPGQARLGRNLRRLLAGSAIRESHRDCGARAGRLRLRCMPQVHGAVRDALDYVEPRARDRDERGDRQPAGLRRDGRDRLGRQLPRPAGGAGADLLAIAVAELAAISERRIERLVNPALSGLPAVPGAARAGSTRAS